MKKPSLLIIFLTVFIDLIGFGIVLPLLPIYSKNFGAHGLMIGAIMAAYSLMQFIFAPIWGRLSDRIGRRPVLLMSTAGAAVSYAIFAYGSSLEGTTALVTLLVARLVAGVCGGNITVAQAYIADITRPEERSAKMGLIGMAFGLGFIFGPVLGGFGVQFFGVMGPGWIASGLCAFNFILALSILPESLKPGSHAVTQRPRVVQFLHTMRHPQLGLMVGVFFLATFCFACFETTIGLLVSQNFHLNLLERKDARTIALLIAYCGIIGAIVQGGMVGRLVKTMGEPRLIAFSLLLGVMLAGLGIFAVGSSLTRPPVFGLISMLAPQNEQGATIGVAQSAGSLARILGPFFAGGFFEIRPALPYLVCSGITLLTAFLCWRLLCGRPIPQTVP